MIYEIPSSQPPSPNLVGDQTSGSLVPTPDYEAAQNQESLWQLGETEARNRLTDCASRYGVELSPARLDSLMSARERTEAETPRQFPNASFHENGLTIEQTQDVGWTYGKNFRDHKIARVHFEPDGYRRPQPGKTAENGVRLIRAVQDYILLAEAGGIANPPDTLISIASNEEVAKATSSLLGFQDFDYAGHSQYASAEDVLNHAFSPRTFKLEAMLLRRSAAALALTESSASELEVTSTQTQAQPVSQEGTLALENSSGQTLPNITHHAAARGRSWKRFVPNKRYRSKHRT